jgi:predicted metal-dependent hydrolase
MVKSSLYPEQQLRRRVAAWSLKLEVNPTRVVIRRMAGKWGSCSPNGVVTFASDLATADVELQDYVVVHELLHLRYPEHGKLFRALLAIHVPKYEAVENALVGERRRAETKGESD